MNIDRLKFAWARGARLQVRNNAEWKTLLACLWIETSTYRIHPDDAHLEYGPLSSALIEDVQYDDVPRKPFASAALRAFEGLAGDDGWPDDMEPGLDAEMYWLFVAEYLADLGL